MRNHSPKHDNLIPAFWPDSDLHRRLRQITRALNRQHTPREHRDLTDLAKELKDEIHARTFM